MKDDKIADGVSVLYEMERAITEAKKINYLPENVQKLRAWWKLYKEVLEKLSIGIWAIDLKLVRDPYEIVKEK